jgi:hypothetical protein
MNADDQREMFPAEQQKNQVGEVCEDCDHGIRGGEPCQSCCGTGWVSYKELYKATAAHVKELKAELAGIDAVMARRPALDKPSRRENIEHAISTAARVTRLEGELENWKEEARRYARNADFWNAEVERLRVLYAEVQTNYMQAAGILPQ